MSEDIEPTPEPDPPLDLSRQSGAARLRAKLPDRTWAAIAVVVLIVVGVAITASVRASSAEADRKAQVAALVEMMKPVEVLYEVEGTAPSASLTIESPSGTEQAKISLPLTNKSGTLGLTLKFNRGAFVYVSAQNEDDFGSVTCRITVDGQVVSENTSTGEYGIASCKGSV